jgi:hypothetical protein
LLGVTGALAKRHIGNAKGLTPRLSDYAEDFGRNVQDFSENPLDDSGKPPDFAAKGIYVLAIKRYMSLTQRGICLWPKEVYVFEGKRYIPLAQGGIYL